MQKTRTPWLKYAKQSFLEALAAMLVFWILYAAHSIEIVRSLAGDTAFTTLNSLTFSDKESNDIHDTPIRVFTIDEIYFKKQGLLDINGDTNYGDIFPRSKFAAFMKTIDELPKAKQPLSLFIDYDFTDGSASYDNAEAIDHISQDDMVFLEQLAKERHYIILLPKNKRQQFVQIYANSAKTHTAKKIAQQIHEGKIIFVGVDFLNSDAKEYRYSPMRQYETNETIYNVALVQWQLVKNGELNQTQIHNEYDPTIFLNEKEVKQKGQAIFKSNILYKNLKDPMVELNDKVMRIKNSYWANVEYASAEIVFQEKEVGFTPNTIVMLGSNFKNRDKHTTGIAENISGIQVHADAIKTVLFLDGRLEHIHLFLGFLIVFAVFFSVTLLSRFILPRVPRKIKLMAEFAIFFLIAVVASGGIYMAFALPSTILFIVAYIAAVGAYYYFMDAPVWFNLLFELVLLIGVMLIVSSYILVEYKLWFNWFIPVLIFYADDLIIVWREYQSMSKMKEEEI